MGIVTGGSGASLEGSVLAQRRRIREIRRTLAELRSPTPRRERRKRKLKQNSNKPRRKRICSARRFTAWSSNEYASNMKTAPPVRNMNA